MTEGYDAAVGIVGAGFSGTMVTAQLARRGVSSLLIDPASDHGPGTAYSTTDPAHLLNVPAKGMSAWPDVPDDFVAFSGGVPDRFVPRRDYGRYLRFIHADAVAGGHCRSLHAGAVAAERSEDGWTLTLDDGASLKVVHLVLATGNEAPRTPPWAGAAGEALLVDPWSVATRRTIAQVAKSGDDIMALGTGLTMVDVALSLDAAGHRGTLHAVSRRGLLPRAHAPHDLAPISRDDVPGAPVAAALAWIRSRAERVGWRSAVDALRPHTQKAWQALPVDAKARFLRHALPWWNVHRHRIAPEVAATLDRMQAEGRLVVRAARIAAVESSDTGLVVTMHPRGSGEDTQRQDVAALVNSVGPNAMLTALDNPLLDQLLATGAIAPDPTGIGIAMDGDRVAGQQVLWALGPPTRGVYWEVTAAPDIRVRAQAVAEAIAVHIA